MIEGGLPALGAIAGRAQPSSDASTATGTKAPASAGRAADVRQVMHHEARETPAGEEFEGFVLRSFVETMLPKENSAFFGKGTAGEIWRSKLAEHIGAELARGGGIGIADALGIDGPGLSEAAASKGRHAE